jgi:hypothetical protein
MLLLLLLLLLLFHSRVPCRCIAADGPTAALLLLRLLLLLLLIHGRLPCSHIAAAGTTAALLLPLLLLLHAPAAHHQLLLRLPHLLLLPLCCQLYVLLTWHGQILQRRRLAPAVRTHELCSMQASKRASMRLSRARMNSAAIAAGAKAAACKHKAQCHT